MAFLFFVHLRNLKSYHVKKIPLLLLAILFSSSSLLTPKSEIPMKTTYVLVHSAWLGAWQWEQVALSLTHLGHTVITPDLPGHGDDPTPAENITMDDYVSTLLDILDQQQEPVILVGHSFNGITISRVAELRPEKISSLVYLTAFLVPAGVSFFDAVQGVQGSKAVENFYLSEDQTRAFVKEEALHQAFAHDVPLAQFEQAAAHIVPEPAAPLGYKLQVSDEVFGKVPKYYIECTEDKAIPIEVQRSMHTGKVRKVFVLDTSHTPNFSAPQKLAHILAKIQ
jgi:pimeloyl-ACP methyl ester carboxylesterase